MGGYIYVSVSGNIDHPEWRKNKLFIHNGSRSVAFTEQAAAYGLDLATYTTQAAFFDYDKDGDLDVYLLNHNVKDFKRFDVEAIRFMRDSFAGHRLMQNNVNINGKFEDVSIKAGIKGSPIGFGLGIHVADLNADTWPDLYVSIDYLEEDFMYINNRDGTFTDEIKSRTSHISYFSMGNDVGDLNNDLLPDIISTDMLPEDNKRQKLLFGPDKYESYLSMLKNKIHPSFMRNMLQLNLGDGTFAEMGQLAGIANTDWSWSVLMGDYDNDGYKDLFFSNGYLRDYTNMDFMKYYADASIQSGTSVKAMIEKMPSTRTPNYIFKNNGSSGQLTFTNKQKEWGFEEAIISNGAVAVDLDRDGDLDLVSNNLNAVASIYKNISRERALGNYLTIHLDEPNKQGTQLRLYAGLDAQYQEFTPIHGYQSSVYHQVHFGLGVHTEADSLVILWPDGSRQKITDLQANQVHAIKKSSQPYTLSASAPETLFTPLPFEYRHQQMPHNDFARQVLLPQMYSYVGPRISRGDVNKDGLIDFYIGGGKGQAGQLFIQDRDGQFKPTVQPDFVQDQLCTDTDAVFFDLDGDGDQDLYVTSGGYQYLEHDLALQNRLYLNDGRGRFTKTKDRITDTAYADNVVKPIDFDRDGDLDLLVGGACIPQQYPAFNPSRLYRNDRGILTKIDCPALTNLGLINDLAIVDFNQDGANDVIAVGEWTGILFLENKYKPGQPEAAPFELTKNGLETLTGFWSRVQPIDMDHDDDLDLVVGNWGLNSQYKATPQEPMTLHAADFDGNGSIDPILSYYIQGQSYPAYSRDELLDQLAVLKKYYTSYELYSTATTDDILLRFKDKTPELKKVTTLKTILLINDQGKYVQGSLPIQAQYAPVYAILATDLNADGHQDLILAGNQAHARVRIGRVDANQGVVLMNTKKGGFEYMPQWASGLKLRGDVKDIQGVDNKIIVGVNGGDVRVYKRK